jgi:hypothetical protein
MITSVTWQYILLNGDSSTGYRVKRRTGGPPPAVNSGIDTPGSDNWVSAPAPPQIHYVPDGKDYMFAFWSLSAHDLQSLQTSAQIQAGTTTANDSHSGGQWTIYAKAYYIWNFAGGGGGNGGGDNPLLIDAFDIQMGDFIGDDFVDVTPDQNGTLTSEANNGFIDTTAEIAQGSSLKVAARDALPAKAFGYWFNIAPLLYSADANFPATVGAPGNHDIVVHHSDRVVAFAFYNEVKQTRFVPPSEYTYDPWWWFKTLGGLVPPPPRDPWLQEFVAALSLAETAGRVSSRLKTKVLEIALEQVAVTATTIKQEIKALEKKK